MPEQTTQTVTEDAQARRLRRAELLLERERAAILRRQRGFGLRLPASQPLVFNGSRRVRIG
jgi:hypothetical protein